MPNINFISAKTLYICMYVFVSMCVQYIHTFTNKKYLTCFFLQCLTNSASRKKIMHCFFQYSLQFCHCTYIIRLHTHNLLHQLRIYFLLLLKHGTKMKVQVKKKSPPKYLCTYTQTNLHIQDELTKCVSVEFLNVILFL